MSKLLVVPLETWFNELSVISSYYEKEYERFFRQCIDRIFEDYHTINFKQDFVYDGEAQRPDLLVIKKDYSEWWVLEAELVGHSEDHIVKQVTTFRKGELKNYYNTAKYICRKAKEELDQELDRDKVYELIQSEMHEVLVVLDKNFEGLKDRLDELGVKLCIFEIYKSSETDYSFRISGEYPLSVIKKSPCKFVDDISNTLHVHEPTILDEISYTESKGIVDVSYNGRITAWRVLKTDDSLYLKFQGEYNQVGPNNDYLLSVDNLKQLHLRVF